MNSVRLVRLEDGNGREWWQIAIRGPWYWPLWRWAQRVGVIELAGVPFPTRMETATFTTREEAEAGLRAVLDKLRSRDVRVVETQRVGE